MATDMRNLRILEVNIALRPPPARKWVPLGFGYVNGALKRAGYSLDLLDLDAYPKSEEDLQSYFQDNIYDVVLMGCLVTGYKHVKKLSNLIRYFQPSTRIIAGNTVGQSVYKTLLDNTEVDIIVVAEGDITIVELMNRLSETDDVSGIPGLIWKKDGQIVKEQARPIIKDINQIPWPDWSKFDLSIYIDNQSEAVNEPFPPIPRDQIRSFPINTARGCPYKCTFCYHTFINEKYRWRSGESIVDEIKHYHQDYGINHFSFADELSFFTPKQTEEVADALIAADLNIYFNADCRSGLFTKDKHKHIAMKMKDAGLLAMSYSLESSDPEILQMMKKKTTGQLDFKKQVEILRECGIASLTSLVFGYPMETEQTIKATIDVCIDSGIYPSAGYLMPQPGTPMYEYSLEHRFIENEEDWLNQMGDRQDLRVNLTKMSDDEFVDIVESELARCSKALGIDLAGHSLLKTGFYRSPDLQN